jgi:vacuolar-type H+-ATPase subunit F/Vma7
MSDTAITSHQKLAQESEDMFERNLSLWAMKRQEVQIIVDGYVISGFLAGLDEYWIQVWGSENNEERSFHLISKESISVISPTEKSTKDLDPLEATEIESKIKNFSNVAYAFNKSLREEKNNNKDGKDARSVGESE